MKSFGAAFGEFDDEMDFEKNNRKRQKTDDNQQHVDDLTVFKQLTAKEKEAQKRSIENAKSLPIVNNKIDIIRMLDRNRVLIISGDTGCGKTTQVPKYILENETQNNRKCMIICTQPRRIAASSIAKRVALELGENVGNRVGYQVGMDSRKSTHTQILFMTTGIFLQNLVNNPDSLLKVTHIIMDEVHERDLDTDFSLVVIKHLLGKILNAERSRVN